MYKTISLLFLVQFAKLFSANIDSSQYSRFGILLNPSSYIASYDNRYIDFGLTYKLSKKYNVDAICEFAFHNKHDDNNSLALPTLYSYTYGKYLNIGLGKSFNLSNKKLIKLNLLYSFGKFDNFLFYEDFKTYIFCENKINNSSIVELIYRYKLNKRFALGIGYKVPFFIKSTTKYNESTFYTFNRNNSYYPYETLRTNNWDKYIKLTLEIKI